MPRVLRNPITKRAAYVGGAAAVAVLAVGAVLLYEKRASAAQQPSPSPYVPSPVPPQPSGGGGGGGGGLPSSGGGSGGDVKPPPAQGMQMYTCLPGNGSCVTDPSQCDPDQTAIPTANC